MKKLDPEIYKDTYKLEYTAYPFFTSVYLKSADCIGCNDYYIKWNDFLNFFENGHLISLKPKSTILKLGESIIAETIAGNSGYKNELVKIHEGILFATNECLIARQQEKVPQLNKWWTPTQKALSHSTALLFQADYSIEQYLEKIKSNDVKKYSLLKQRFFGTHISFMNQANYRLLKLSKDYSNDFDSVYDIFIKEYGWFLNSYGGPFQITKKWLEDYLFKVKKEEIKDFVQNSDLKSKDFSAHELDSLIELSQFMSIFRDDKKKLLLIVVESMNRWMQDIADKHSLDYNDLLWLTLDEIMIADQGDTELFEKAKEYSKNKKRIGLMNDCGYSDVDESVWMGVFQSFIAKESSTEIKGTPAYKGVVRGIVRVILNPELDGDKLNSGDILVVSMTKPDFLPLLGRAAAFITDQGGIACHAAIIAREMKKPCIIGTKVATKVLKDGDFVEVDAENGIVTKINN